MTEETYGRPTSDPAALAGPAAFGGEPYAGPDISSYTATPDDAELGGILQWSGALVSLALVAGMGLWGWQLATRDVADVPVVLALEGPMRVAPETPGGAAIPHQGLAVNAVQEARGATPVPDQLRVLDEPETLLEQDVVAAPLSDPAPLQPDDLAARNLARVDRLVAGLTGSEAPLTTVSRSAVALPDRIGPTPLLGGEAPLAQTAQVPVIVAGGLGRSLRPVQRPEDVMAVRASAPAVVASPAPVVTPGSRLVQLGAFDSVARAETAWAVLQASEFAPLLEGRSKVVEQAVSGGRTFYRLRAAGFADLADARRFCAALKSGQADCIPVRAR